MQTQVLKVNPSHPEASVVQEAVARLEGGGLVAMPTETVYGLAADARSAQAVQRIFQAKGRPARNPVIVHAADVAAAKQVVSEWPNSAEQLASAFWPGPLTLVLRRAGWVPGIVTAGGSTVGVRVPSHPVAHAVLRAGSLLLAAPSANRSQSISPTRAEHVLADLEGRIELILDAGPTPGGIESTVLGLTPTPHILRPGPITQEMLEAALGRACPYVAASPDTQAVLASPGLLKRHYAPRTHLECSTVPAKRFEQLRSEGQRVGWLTLPIDGTVAPTTDALIIPMPAEPIDYARRLYSELHLLDRQGLDLILVTLPPDTPEWTAIRDRLRRASSS